MCDRWKQTLATNESLNIREEGTHPLDDPMKEREQHLKQIEREPMQDAIKWWTFFLDHHERVFGSGVEEWSFAVEKIDRAHVTTLLPFTSQTPVACLSSMEVSMQPGSSMEVSLQTTTPFIPR